MTIERLAYWIHRITTSRYVLSLEARIAQLEQQNLALQNTVFGIRGLPPVHGVQQYKSTTAAPEAPQDAAPEIRPKVQPIFRNGNRRMSTEEQAKQAISEAQKRRELIENVKSEFGKEVKEWREKQAGRSAAVPAGAQDPVMVEEPTVEAPAQEEVNA